MTNGKSPAGKRKPQNDALIAEYNKKLEYNLHGEKVQNLYFQWLLVFTGVLASYLFIDDTSICVILQRGTLAIPVFFLFLYSWLVGGMFIRMKRDQINLILRVAKIEVLLHLIVDNKDQLPAEKTLVGSAYADVFALRYNTIAIVQAVSALFFLLLITGWLFDISYLDKWQMVVLVVLGGILTWGFSRWRAEHFLKILEADQNA